MSACLPINIFSCAVRSCLPLPSAALSNSRLVQARILYLYIHIGFRPKVGLILARSSIFTGSPISSTETLPSASARLNNKLSRFGIVIKVPDDLGSVTVTALRKELLLKESRSCYYPARCQNDCSKFSTHSETALNYYLCQTFGCTIR